MTVIVGDPLNMDGTSGKSSQSVKDKINNISKKIPIPICLWDERLSTVGANTLSTAFDENLSK